jgi:hypothetical protein
MGRLTIRRGLALGAALMAGGALALPFASQATTSTPATTSTGTTTATTATTTPPPANPLPPLVYTGEPQPLTDSSAVLKGLINPRGYATQYYFQYGPTAAYGLQTPLASAGAGNTNFSASATVSGLSAALTYHFRLVAVGPGGAVQGSDRTFHANRIPLSITVFATPDPVIVGAALRIGGAISGTGDAGREVILQMEGFPFLAGFRNIGNPELTDAAGSFSFSLPSLTRTAQIRVYSPGSPVITSQVILEPVAVRVSLYVSHARRHFVRIHGTVSPSEVGALVAIERLTRNHRYVPVSGTVVKPATGGAASFSRVIRVRRPDVYRVLVRVANGAYVSGRSRSVLIR